MEGMQVIHPVDCIKNYYSTEATAQFQAAFNDFQKQVPVIIRQGQTQGIGKCFTRVPL
jgi:hypothetical protein